MTQIRPSTQQRQSRVGRVAWVLLGLLAYALLSQQTEPTWAQPNQSRLNQSIPTEVLTATPGPTATRTATPAAGV